MSEYKRLTRRGEDWFYSPPEYVEVYNRLAELEDKLENGTLYEFPCKVGDTIYWPNIFRPTPRVEEYTVYGFGIYDNKIAVAIGFNRFLYLDEISFTRAEAQQRLEEVEDE